MATQVLTSHELFRAHIARRHTLFQVDVLNMFTHSSLSIELLATKVTFVGVLAGMVEHVSPKLRVLDETLSTNSTDMVLFAGAD